MIERRPRELVELLSTYVPGRARPKGSWRALPGGHVKRDDPDEARWAHNVAFFMRAAMRGRAPFDCPVMARLDFFLPRDFVKHTKHGPVFCERGGPMPDSAPDVDKLVRSVLDATKKGLALVEDGRVVALDVWKLWAEDNPLPGEAGKPGVAISILQVMP